MGTSADLPLSSAVNPTANFTPATSIAWVNGLWFTSLSLSLSAALISVLVKQWLHHYMILPSGTPRERSRIRQYRYMGLHKWQVPLIIGLLPMLMHLALAFFFVGLVVFLGPMHSIIAWGHRWYWNHRISICYCNECPPLLVLTMPLPHATSRCCIHIGELFFATCRSQAQRFLRRTPTRNAVKSQ